MSKVKKYYWLKLKDDFFEDDRYPAVEEQEILAKITSFHLKL